MLAKGPGDGVSSPCKTFTNLQVTVRDLFLERDIAQATGHYSTIVDSHGVAVLKLTPTGCGPLHHAPWVSALKQTVNPTNGTLVLHMCVEQISCVAQHCFASVVLVTGHVPIQPTSIEWYLRVRNVEMRRYQHTLAKLDEHPAVTVLFSAPHEEP